MIHLARNDDSSSRQALPTPLEVIPRQESQTSAALHQGENEGRERSRYLGRVVVRLGDKLLLVHLREVLWIQSKGNLVCLHLPSKDYDCRMTMKELSSVLDPNYFLRVHRNAIVNLEYVVEFDLPRNGNAFVRLSNGQALPISRTGRAALSRSLWSRSLCG